MKKSVLIADTWGKAPHRELERKFPNARFHTLGPEVADHPHGVMVTEVFLNRFGQEPIDVFLYAYLSDQRENPVGWLEWAIKMGIPWVNCSFGADARGTSVVPKSLNLNGVMAQFAAGNSDQSQRGRPDLTWDVAEPQRSLVHLEGVTIIGSCNADGLPSTFSSDGLVDVSYRGERHRVWNPITRRWEHVDGTSFADPLATADAVREGFTTEAELKAYWLKHATQARGWEKGKIHPKVGVGFMDDTIPVADATELLTYMEYKLL